MLKVLTRCLRRECSSTSMRMTFFFFSDIPGFQRFVHCRIGDLDVDQCVKDFHYMAISLNHIYTGSDKFKNAFACLIDVDANHQEERDEVIKYARNNYDKDDILAIITKDPESVSKHRYGCHILILCDKDVDKYRRIHKDFLGKFDCVDKHISFFCVKNPLYKYFKMD